MNNNSFIFVYLVSLIFASSASADTDKVISESSVDKNYTFNEKQEFIVNSNDTIAAISSRYEITRISFEKEIAEINAIAGELEYSISSKDIFLRINSDKPVNFFVKLENESTYKFILTPENIPAAQIFVKYPKSNLEANLKTQTYYHDLDLPDLKKRLNKSINIALKPAPYLGFKIIPQSKRLQIANKNFTLQLFEVIEGQGLQLEKIYLTNQSEAIQHLNLKEFLNENIAGYVGKKTLLPKEQTLLIRITEIKRSK